MMGRHWIDIVRTRDCVPPHRTIVSTSICSVVQSVVITLGSNLGLTKLFKRAKSEAYYNAAC